MNQPPQRVSPISSPQAYTLPARPEEAATAEQDAFRQTQFLLRDDLSLFADLQSLQLALVQDAYPSRYRSHALGAVVALWSRAYAYLADALLLLSRGGYISCLPLARTACEVIAAQEALRTGAQDGYNLWLMHTLKPDETFKAFEFELGRFFAGEVLASDPMLRGIYRPASELARPNFGASLLQTAPESNNLRLALSFGDRTFHLGWAELSLGWLLALSMRQLQIICDYADVFPVSEQRRSVYEALSARVEGALGRDDRCRMEEVETPSARRYIVSGFRRSASAVPKKIVL